MLPNDRDAGIDLVMNTLKDNKYGLSIAEVSRKSGMNRNSAAKYLNILVTLGQVEMQIVGPARVYHLSPRMPISPAFFSFLPDPAIFIAENGEILKVNKLFAEYFSLYARAVIGKKICETSLDILHEMEQLPAYQTARSGKVPEERGWIQVDTGSGRYLLWIVPTVFFDGRPSVMCEIVPWREDKTVSSTKD